MVVNRELDNFLSEYDGYRSSVAFGKKIETDINFLPNEKVLVLVRLLENGNEFNRYQEDFYSDFDFLTYVIPKIISRIISNNVSFEKRKIIGGNGSGTFIASSSDGKENLIIRNCSFKIMELFSSLESVYKDINSTSTFGRVNINDKYTEKEENYFKYNVAMDYAFYRRDFLDSSSKANIFDLEERKSYLDKENRDDNENIENLIILDVARYAVQMGLSGSFNVWDEIKNYYSNDLIVGNICSNFKKLDFSFDSIYRRALICAQFEKTNEGFIMENFDIIKEALEAMSNGICFGTDKFLEYWDSRRRYYRLLGNEKFVSICSNFFDSNRLLFEENKDDDKVEKKNSLVSQIKAIKENSRPDFSTMINDPIEIKEEYSSGPLFKDTDHAQLAIDAEEQAKKIMEVLKERDQIKKDAEEFAKIILKEQKERKQIIRDAEEQAKKIFELQKENEELRRLAEDNARSIFEREKKFEEEIRLREVEDNSPISRADIDKINNLLTALSFVKELDFAINHPTVMQEVNLLEQKIVTYLVTHKNIIETDDKSLDDVKPVEEKKTPTELLAIIRNAYVSSHSYEREGRHTVINIVPSSDDKYRVTLYSVKNDSADILTDVYFDSMYFDEDVIKELCDIYSDGAVIIASKTDNIPFDKADYLVIDNQDNAIKFMGCSKEIIMIAKAYL